jgi:hypothetical protein
MGVCSCIGVSIRAMRRTGLFPFALSIALVLGSTSAAFGQTLATNQFTPGWATFGVALPKGAATSGLKVGTLTTQTDVKNTWPDGSIKFAVVTARIPASGSYAITPAARSVGTFTATLGSVAVKLTIAGTTWTAPMSAGTDSWLSGPLVSENRILVTPTAGGVAHPFLRVLYDVRGYNDATRRIDVTVQNTLDVAVADRVTYDVSIVVDGGVAFSQGAVEHPYMMRWRKVIAAGGLQQAAVTPELESAYSAKALPRYMAGVYQSSLSVTGEKWGILRTGDLLPDMGSTGGRPEIGPYPDWTAQYLVSRRADLKEYVLRNGDLAGSWSVHLTKPDGLSLISIDERPDYTLQLNYPAENIPANKLRGMGFVEGTVIHQTADNAHQPSLAYVPYLLTGDRYYSDEMAYWANYSMLLQPPVSTDGRSGSQGLLRLDQPRGIAWGLRALTDAGSYLPDSHPLKQYFIQKVQNNLNWADQYSASHVRPLDSVLEAGVGANPFRITYSQWQCNYIAWAIDHAHQQGWVGGSALLERILRLQLRLFTDSDWPRQGAAPYYPVVGYKWPDQTEQWLTTVAQMRDATAEYWGAGEGGFPNFVGAYGIDARLALMMARDRNMPGALDSLTYLMSQPQMGWYVRNRAGWAIDGGPAAAGIDDGPDGGSGPRPSSPSGLRVIR